MPAQKAFGVETDKGEAQAVLFFSHPMHNQIRFPLQDKANAAEQGKRQEVQKNAAIEAKKKEAAANRDKAKQLSADAKKLEAEVAAHEKNNE